MKRRVFLTLVGCSLLACIGCGSPKLGTSDNAFKTVDALFTAVSAKNPKLLEEASDKLDKLKESDELAPDAHEFLQGIIAQAREGKWQPATKELRTFIRAQIHRTD